MLCPLSHVICNSSWHLKSHTWSDTAYRIAMMQGRQQQTAMPMIQARATQNTTKNTSNARKTMQSLQSKSYRNMFNLQKCDKHAIKKLMLNWET